MKRTPLKRKAELRSYSGLKRSEGPSRKSAPKRTQPKRDWTQARQKVEHADCRLCAPDENCGPVEAAHVIGRECDRPRECGRCDGTGRASRLVAARDIYGSPMVHEEIVQTKPCPRCHGAGLGKELIVHPDSVIPLGRGHHQKYDAHEVDVLPVLTLEEQLRAVEDAGGIELARQRTCPSQYRSTERI